MKLISSIMLLFLSLAVVHGQKAQSDNYQSKLSDQSSLYQENKGQIMGTDGKPRPEVLFTSFSNGVRTYYKRSGISYVFEKHNGTEKPKSPDLAGSGNQNSPKDFKKGDHTVEMHRIDLNFIGSNPYCSIKTDLELDAKDNYYLSNIRVSDVKSYQKVSFTDLYDKIDLVLYMDTENNLKYDFVVHPGGDPSRIKMQIDGTDDFGLSAEGLFFLGSELGKITETAPVTFQQDKQTITSSFQLEKAVLSFKVADYDKTQDLIIDPTRQWGTYYTAFGSTDEWGGVSIDADASGVIFAVNTYGSSFPASPGVYDPSYNGGYDIRIAKFDPSGALLWGTYLGGSNDDLFPAVSIGAPGTFVLAGGTFSNNFPTTAGTHDQSFNGNEDYFICQFASSGGTLNWSTYFGGSDFDNWTPAIDVSPSGEIAFAGTTYSSDVPMVNALDNSFSGNLDQIVAKFSNSGNLVWSSYFGGNSDEYSTENNVQFDHSGNIIISGATYSSDLPTTAGVFQSSYNGASDLYLASFNPLGTALNFCTYIGSGCDDSYNYQSADGPVGAITVCSDNSIIITSTGSGCSATWAATSGAYSTGSPSSLDGYIIKMSSTGNRIWGTTIPGDCWNMMNDVTVDGSDNVYFLSGTCSVSNVTTGDAFQTSPLGDWNKYLGKLSANGSSLIYATYLGSNSFESYVVGSLAYTGGSLYMTSLSQYGGFNSSWMTSTGAYQQLATGSASYPILNKFQFCDIQTSGVATNLTCGNTDGAVNLTATSSTETPLTYSWSNGPATEDISSLPFGTYTVTVTGGTTGCSVTQSFNIGLNDAIAPVAVCQNYTATLDGTGNVTVTPANINNGSSDNCAIASMSVAPNTFDCGDMGPNSVTLTVTDLNGNTATCISTVTVTETTPPVITCAANVTTTNVPGTCGAVVTYAAPTATDNCGSGNPTLENVLSGFNTNYNTVFGNIPSPVVFNMDNGVNGNSIGDGYSDMYDGGNYLNTNYASGISYSDNTIINSASFGSTGRYFTRYIANGAQGSLSPCMFVLAADLDNVSSFSTTGNLGADGSGSVDGTAFNLTIGGVIYNCFVKRVFNAFDPSVNQLIILPAAPAASQFFSGSSDNNDHNVTSINAATRIYYLLYAGNNGGYIDNAQTLAIATSFINAIGSGNAVTLTQTAGLPSGSTFPGGITTNTFQGTDAAGNSATCSFTVTVTDTEAPSITCPANLNVSGTSGGAAVTYSLPLVTDNCPGTVLNQTAGFASGATFPVGTTTNTFVVTDVSGNTNTCSFTVTVTVTGTPPSIVCPADISVNNDAGNCSAVVSFSATETTGSPASTITYSHAPGSVFPVGTTTVTATATNVIGTSACTFDITVTDSEAPTAVCQPFTVSLDATGNAFITASDIDNGSFDNCHPVSLTLDVSSFDCSNVGPNTVNLTVTEAPAGGVHVLNPPSGLIGHWTFEPGQETTDLTGNWMPLTVNGSAAISSGKLDVDAFPVAGYAHATGYSGAPISDKTLISYVSLDDYTIFAGSALTIDAISIDQFDGLIYAENEAFKWQNGSNGGVRNQAFAPGYAEIGNNELIQLAFTYDVTGPNVLITGYRNGVQIGSYTSGSAATWTAGDVEILMGIRHLFGASPIASSDMKIDEALLFNRALSAGEIMAMAPLSSTCSAIVTVQDITPPTVNCTDITVPLDAAGNASITASQIIQTSTNLYTVDQSGTFAPLPVGGTQLFLGDDVTSGSLPVGFNFSFFGNTYNQFTLSSNGFMSFDPAVSNGCCQGGVIPTNDAVNNFISFSWNDLYPPGGGTVFYETIGTAPNRKLVVSYTDIPHYQNNSSDHTAQIVLNETSNLIEIHSTNITDDSSPHTMGIENSDGSAGFAVPGRNSANWTATNDYVAFIPASSASDNCGIVSMTVSPNTFDCSNVGPNTVTATVTDAAGNISTCISTVTIQDVTPPNAMCQNIDAYIDASGNAIITAAQVDNGSTDVCGVGSLSLDQTSFSCGQTGANTVILTVTDVSGNASTCTATVTVHDTIAPVIACPGDTVVYNDLNVCGAVVNFVTPACGGAVAAYNQVGTGFSDGLNAAIVADDFTIPAGECWNVNQISLPYFVANGATPTDVTSFDISFYNDLPGTPGTVISTYNITPGDFSYTWIGSNYGFPVYRFDINLPAPVSLCGGASGTTYWLASHVNNAAGAFYWECTPGVVSGNQAMYNGWSPDSGVFGQPTDQVFTVYKAGTGGVLSDNCSCPTVTQTAGLPSGSTFPVGTTTNTFEATDASGNTTSCSFDVTVTDTEAPNAICQPVTVSLDATGNASITPAMVDNGSTDNCGIASITLDNMAFTCANVGPNTVTLTVTDVNGNVSTCTSTVTVQDLTPPTAICQNITAALDATGNATITPAMVDNGSNDICGIAGLALDQTAFTCTNVGPNTVTLTVTDVNGNVSTCSATVTVVDAIAPNAICQNITAALDVTGNATITPAQVDNGSTDNCGIASITLDQTAFTCVNVGPNTVTLTVTDVNGNVSTCSATVTVVDAIAPNAICQNITANLDAAGNVSITPAQVDNGSTDNCGIASITLDQTAFTCANVGPNTVTLTVTDVNGNISTCTSTVTVQDLTPPTAICQNITATLDASGNATITPTQIDNGSNDNCGIAGLTLDQTTFTCANVGPNTVNLTVTDVNGNISTCTSTVTVQDLTPPTAICQNITANLDAAGNVTITPAQIDNGSNDACGIAGLTLDQTAFTCVNVGPNTVTLSVTDVNGNSSACTATVTVVDAIAPNAICQNINAYLDATGNVSITPAQVDNGSNDNCTIATMTLDKSAFVCGDLGANTVILTVTDVNGNVSTCTSTVTVLDTITPAFTSTQANITVNNVTGVCGKVVTYPMPTFADNCTSTMTQTDGTALTSGDLFPVGTTTQTYTITDAGGNTEVLTFTITVLDVENPVISNCPSNITVSASASACGNNVNWTMPTVSDNCPGAVMTSSHTPGSFFPVGTTTVSYNAIDNSGNTATCVFTVTVNDNVAPVAPVLAAVTGECSATVTAPTAMDACSGPIVGTTVNPTTYSTQGTYTVTWTFVDGAGNTSTAAQTVIVDDVNAPAVPVLATVTGQCSATVTAPTTTDNCAGIITGTTANPTTYSAQGTYTVNWTFNDGNGNISTAAQTVVVNDVTPPTAVCQNFTVNLSASGNASVTAANINNGSTDNCGIATMTVSPNTFDCSNVGANTVTLTVTDINGNTSTCTSTVTVQDVTPLTWVSTTANVSVNSSPGLCGRTVNYTLPVYSDNCPATMTQTDGSGYTNGDVFPVGTTTQTYTVTNGAGQTITHTFTVTVLDVQAPVIASCPANITVNTSAATCGTNVTWSAPTASDNCSGVLLTTTNAPGSFFPVGTTTVTYTATDNSGNTATCVFTVTVNDNAAPVAPVLATVTGECSATVTAPTAMDACSGPIVGTTVNPTTYSTQGTYTVTWTFVDGAGNTSTAAQTVIVDDVTAPVVPVLATVTGQCSATVTAPTTTDNCAGTITGTTVNPTTYSAQGTYTVNWTFNDGNGNTSTAIQTVVVNDVTPPTAVCQNFTVNLSASGNASITAANINNGSTDNCGIATMTVSPNTFDCSNVGANTVTLTVTDINGNTSTCTSTVTVQDVTPLVFVTTPSNTTVNAIPGFCGRTVNYVLPTYSDNCPATMTQTDGSGYTSGDVFPVGTTTQTYTVTNGAGQTITHTFTITVVDTQFPVIASCPANITINTSAATCGTNVTWSAPTASDNCPGVLLTTTNAPGSFFPVGTTTVTYTATDNSGNTATCVFTVTVNDNVAPVAPVLATVTGECSATVTAPTAMDACSGPIVGTTVNPTTYSIQGTYTVTWTFVDGAGNTSTAAQTVIVDDVTAPVVPVLATATGECSASVTVPTATDNCSGTITGTTTDPLTYTTQGTHSVIWTFNDGNGNISTATQTVIVDDITAPAVPVLADVTGECSATAAAPTTTDNCSGTITGTTTDALTYTTQGTHVITWTFDDGNGNTSTTAQNVVIDDVTAPTIAAPADTTVYANYFGCSALDLVFTSPVTNDNCSVVSVTNDAPNPLPFGNTTVTWTVTDINGNTTTDQQVVTVTSNITSTIDVTTCDTYMAPDSAVYNTSGVYTATIPSYLGCDSLITVNLTILNSTTASITVDACDEYTAPDGQILTNSGVYTAIIPNAAGCDSIITVNLTIHTLNLAVGTQQNGTELVAFETGVTYQWFNCSTDSIVFGATSQTFIPVLTADYSVILSDGVCIDTTDCYNISLDVVIPEVISPNGDGKNDVFEIIGIEDYPQNHMTIFNRWGQVVFEADGYSNEWDGTNQSPGAVSTNELPVGTYFYVLDLGPSDDIYVGHVYKGYVYLTR